MCGGNLSRTVEEEEQEEQEEEGSKGGGRANITAVQRECSPVWQETVAYGPRKHNELE